MTDPVYPVYVDTNVMAGRTGAADAQGRYAGITYLPGTERNGFVPDPPAAPVEIAYLCSPNNPTGAVMTRAQLEAWVAWARACDAVLIFDAAYDAYISDPALPRSIYEIAGARECAIEMRSYSKRAGFTGVRCAYTVIPKELTGSTASGERVPLHGLWSRRHATKFNGVPYVDPARGRGRLHARGPQADRGAGRALHGQRRRRSGAASARRASAASAASTPPTSGCARRTASRAGTASTGCSAAPTWSARPAAGFGAAGEGYFRISAFNSRENVEEAIARIARAFAS